MSRNIFKIVGEYLKENKKTTIAYVLLSFRTPLRQVLMPSYYGAIIEKMGSPKTQNWKSLKSDVIGVTLSWVTAQGMSSILDWMDSTFIPGIQSHVRERIVLDIIESYSTRYKDLPLGDIIAKTIKLPIVIKEIAHQIRGYILPTFALLTSVIGWFTYLDKGLGAIMAGSIGLVGLAMKSFVDECFKYSTITDHKHSALTEEVEDILSNLLTVYSMNQVKEEIKRIEALQDDMDETYTKTIMIAAKFRVLFNACFFAMFGGIATYAYGLMKKGKLSTQHLASITITLTYVMSSLGGIGGEIRDFVFNIGVIKHTQEYLDNVLPQAEKEGTSDFHVSKGEIRFDDVSLKYGDNIILNNFTNQISSGETIGIVGKIGSGKSSLIKLLLNLVERDGGEILIDGVDVKDVPRHILRREVIYVHQHPKLFNRSIYDNIVYGLEPKPSQTDVESVMKELGLQDIFNSGSNHRSINDMAGKNGNNLSGGQKQTVSLLRCLMSDCKIVVLDEPTSSLDPQLKAKLLRLLKAVTSTRTAMIVTHDTDVYPILDRLINLSRR